MYYILILHFNSCAIFLTSVTVQLRYVNKTCKLVTRICSNLSSFPETCKTVERTTPTERKRDERRSVFQISETNGTINFEEENYWIEWGEYVWQERSGRPGRTSDSVKEMFRIDDIANNLSMRNALPFERPLFNFSLSRPSDLTIFMSSRCVF